MPHSSRRTFEISPMMYTGLCDASAGIGLSPTQFAVINDEDNVVRFFTFGNPKPAPETRTPAPW